MRHLVVLSLILTVVSVAPVPALAGEAEQEAVRAQCVAELTVPAGTCDCLAGKAAELTEGQQQLLAAMVTHDEATAGALRTQLPLQDVMQVGMFHVHQTPACAG